MGHRRYLLDDEASAEPVAEASVAPEPPLPAQHSPLTPANAVLFQHAIGNAAVARLVYPVDEKAGEGVFYGAQEATGSLDVEEGEEEEGAVATPVPVPAHVQHPQSSPDIGQGEQNEFGELTGELDTGVPVCLFINGGRVGEGLVNWAGGNGGQGNQAVGAVELTAPEYEGEEATDKKPARAWIKDGTGKVKVVRSFNSVRLGDNSPYYFTAKAVARADVHEKKHVKSTKEIHDAHLAPLEKRVKKHKGRNSALKSGATKAEAIKALQDFVNWNDAVTKFQTEDSTANTPMGTVDTLDLARPDFVKDYGVQMVKGVQWDHYIDVPPGPKPKKPKKTKTKATAGAT